MKTGFKWLPILVLLLPAVRAESGELLGKISDETAPVAAQSEQPSERNDRKIIYRVICSPEGEVLPECEQPPVHDTFDAAQPRPAEPEAVGTPGVETPNGQVEKVVQENQPVEPAVPKKAAAHKKRAKKSAKKSAQKTAKPVKRKQR